MGITALNTLEIEVFVGSEVAAEGVGGLKSIESFLVCSRLLFPLIALEEYKREELSVGHTYFFFAYVISFHPSWKQVYLPQQHVEFWQQQPKMMNVNGND